MLLSYWWFCCVYGDWRFGWIDLLIVGNGVVISVEIGGLAGIYVIYVCIAYGCPHTIEITHIA